MPSKNKLFKWNFVSLVAIFAALAIVVPGSAQEGGSIFLPFVSEGASTNSVDVVADENGAKVGEDVYTALANDGEARIFIMLNESELGEVNAASISSHKEKVAALQENVLATLQDDSRINSAQVEESVKTFNLTAAMILTVTSEEMLDTLVNNAVVQKIDLAGNGGTGGLGQSIPLVGASISQSNGFTGAGVTIAVIDSGFDSDHPALAGALVDEACFSAASGANICPNGTRGPGSAEDDESHGTHVTSIAASRGGDGVSVGMAPEAKIAALKVLDSNNSFQSTSQLVDAWDYIFEELPEVKIVTMSLGTSALFTGVCDDQTSWLQAMSSSVRRLQNRGVLVIAITGNNGSETQMQAPGCLGDVLSVTMSRKDDQWGGFGNSNRQTDLIAPGVNILAANLGGGATQKSGTSMSAPHVAGCAALLVESGITNVNALKTRLKQSPVSITDPDNGISFPRLDCTIGDAPAQPTATPPAQPTATPPAQPTFIPPAQPTATPPAEPTFIPPAEPTFIPPAEPTFIPPAEPTFIPPAPVSCGGLMQEAEAALLSGRFVVGNDSAASGGAYVHVPNGTGNSFFGSPSRIEFCMNITTAGTYRINGNAYAKNSLSDSFFVTVDGQPSSGYLWFVNNNTTYAADYVNDRAGNEDPVEIFLTPGDHTVVVYLREDGTRLDKLALELVGGTPPTAVPPQATPTPQPGDKMIYFSPSRRSIRINNVVYRNHDVIGYNIQSRSWSMVIDGSDIGLSGTDILSVNALADGSFVFTINSITNIANLGWVDQGDILRFIPTSLGDDTTGRIEKLFDIDELTPKFWGSIDGLSFGDYLP